MSDDDPFGSSGLRPVSLDDRPVFDDRFENLSEKLSDYTFANTFIWRDTACLRWGLLADCLCVFANGTGGLTLLLPPMGGDVRRALPEALDLCRAWNAEHGYCELPRVEYVSADALAAMPGEFTAQPMSGDYVYLTARMIDLAGGDLASKRHDRNRFARNHDVRTEPFADAHAPACLDLLARWDRLHTPDPSGGGTVAVKRNKDAIATADALRHHAALGLTGRVLWADGQLAGFTFGERLDGQTCSVLIEKTDLTLKGSAQYIFSAFCREDFPDTLYCNAGDDWDVPSLAWTKLSYRPVRRLEKWCVLPAPTCSVAGLTLPTPQDPLPDRAGRNDLPALLDLERRSFAPELALSRRQMRDLLRNQRASVHVIRRGGIIAAAAILTRRATPAGKVGRLYSLAVDEHFRRQDLGRSLLETCLAAAHSEHLRAVLLEVAADNAPAIGLYERAGFARSRLLRNYYGLGRDGWKMRLDLPTEPVNTSTAAATFSAEGE
jgi:uncharacterized protein